MFSLAFVCLFVCLLAELRKNYSTDFHGICWKGGTSAIEETSRLFDNPDHIMLELGLWLLWGPNDTGHGRISVCFIVTKP